MPELWKGKPSPCWQPGPLGSSGKVKVQLLLRWVLTVCSVVEGDLGDELPVPDSQLVGAALGQRRGQEPEGAARLSPTRFPRQLLRLLLASVKWPECAFGSCSTSSSW